LAQLPMQYVSGVLWHSKLVARIQRRLVRILVTTTEKIKYDKKVPTQRACAPSLEDLKQATRHNLLCSDGELRCIDCSGSCSAGSKNVASWLRSSCDARPYDDSNCHVSIPKWHSVLIGNNVPNSSHELCSFKGIVYCNICGAYSTKKCRLLNAQCKLHPTIFSERALGKLKAGALPSDNARWPKPHNCVMRTPAISFEIDRVAVDKRAESSMHSDMPTINHFDDAEFFGELEEE
jgi:hypothetical protein